MLIALLAAVAGGLWARRSASPRVPTIVEPSKVEATPPVPAPRERESQDRGATLDAPHESPTAKGEETPQISASPPIVGSRHEKMSPPVAPSPSTVPSEAAGAPVLAQGVVAESAAAHTAPAPRSPTAIQVEAPIPREKSTTPAPSKEEPAAAPPEDPHSDHQPPVLEQLQFEPSQILDGGVAVLSITATDDLSGVKLVAGTVNSPGGAAVVPFTARDDAGTGVVAAAITIPRHAETGSWFVGSLEIRDKADNVLVLNYEKTSVPQGGWLRVVSADSDSQPPSVHFVSIEKGVVDPEEANHITIEVDDDRSGVASVSGAFQNPSKTAFVPFTCRPGGGVSSWQAEFRVPANADCGEWTLRHLTVSDNASNTAELSGDDPPISGAGFRVSAGACDSSPPVIDAMQFAPAAVSNEEAAEVVLTIAVHDEGTGVASVSGRIEGPASPSGQVPWIGFESVPDPQAPDAPLTAKIQVPKFAARGVWRVAWVQATDKARNTHPYYRDNPVVAGAVFSVN